MSMNTAGMGTAAGVLVRAARSLALLRCCVVAIAVVLGVPDANAQGTARSDKDAYESACAACHAPSRLA